MWVRGVKKTRWLDRRIAAPGPYLCLCLSQAEFDVAMRHLRLPTCSWIRTPQADATAHHAQNDKGDLVSVVCLRGSADRSSIEIAGLLVHEATHIWQEYAEFYGETDPGREQEAYAIQSLSQELMAEYARRLEEGLP